MLVLWFLSNIDRDDGAVAELADALDLGSSSFGSAVSIPVSPTFVVLGAFWSFGGSFLGCTSIGNQPVGGLAKVGEIHDAMA